MITTRVRDALSLRINNRLFYGWPMLGVGALGLFASGAGQSYIFSVFITPISTDLGITRSSTSLAYAAATLVAALGLPYTGRLVDRVGARVVLLWVTALFGVSAIAFGYVTNIVYLAIGFAALRFLGQGSLMLSCSNLVAQWFSRRRGFALSLMSLGFSLSMAVHPPLAQWLIDQVGWREAWLWLGVMTSALMLPVAALLIQNRPEDMGLRPDGDTLADLNESGGESIDDAADVGLTLKEATRTTAFWIIAVALSSLSLLVTGMFFHQVSILDEQGLTPQTASQVFALSAATMVVFMPVMGRLLDRFPTQLVLVGALLLMSGASVALAAVTGPFSALAYGFVFGAANAALHTNVTYVWPRFFGRKHLGSIQGAAQTVSVVGASLGPLPFGFAYDLYGSYTGGLLACAALPVICAFFVAFAKAPRLASEAGPI